MLIKTVNIHYPAKEVVMKERYISKEFLCSPHQCVVSRSVSVLKIRGCDNFLCKRSNM